MVQRLIAITVGLALLLTGWGALPFAGSPARLAVAAPAGGDVIVVLADGANPVAVAAAAGVTPKRVYSSVFRGFAARVPAAAMHGLVNNPNVAIISEDLPVSVAAQTLPSGVN